MLIKEIISLINNEIKSTNEVENQNATIRNITNNLQHSLESDLVFYKVQSNPDALEKFFKRIEDCKAGLVIINSSVEIHIKNKNCLFVDEDNFLRIQKKLLDSIFPNKNKLKLVGVTGTNGKTTTVNLAMEIASSLGHPSFSVGTIGIRSSKGELVSNLEATTPSYIEVRKIIHQYQDQYEACFMEVSSHALVQGRIFDLKLDGAIWTSFSQDHLDYHKTMDEYFEAKLLIEKKYLAESSFLIVPSQEEMLFKMILEKNPNARLKKAKKLKDLNITNFPLFYHSIYNQNNVECAFQVIADLWGEKEILNFDLNKIKTPHGRFSVVELKNNSMAIIDYAHTPDALTNIGEALKSAFPNHSRTVVFGCGGNRDKSKRPLMAKAVENFASKIIITSDNPRDEAPEDIIIDILNGMTKSYEAVVDRKKAILYALESVGSNEIILIAGKGHEEYQEIRGVKYAFSDFSIVKEFNEK